MARCIIFKLQDGIVVLSMLHTYLGIMLIMLISQNYVNTEKNLIYIEMSVALFSKPGPTIKLSQIYSCLSLLFIQHRCMFDFSFSASMRFLENFIDAKKKPKSNQT